MGCNAHPIYQQGPAVSLEPEVQLRLGGKSRVQIGTLAPWDFAHRQISLLASGVQIMKPAPLGAHRENDVRIITMPFLTRESHCVES
jgi:hypothetical protein